MRGGDTLGVSRIPARLNDQEVVNGEELCVGSPILSSTILLVLLGKRHGVPLRCARMRVGPFGVQDVTNKP